MSPWQSHSRLLHRGAMGAGIVAAIVLLAFFYSTVHHAVDRASQRIVASRLASLPEASQSARAALASGADPSSARLFAPRTVSFVRSSN